MNSFQRIFRKLRTHYKSNTKWFEPIKLIGNQLLLCEFKSVLKFNVALGSGVIKKPHPNRTRLSNTLWRQPNGSRTGKRINIHLNN